MENAIVFDVETLVKEHNRPIIAAAVSSDAWFNFIFIYYLNSI
jgi:hypothetical protein